MRATAALFLALGVSLLGLHVLNGAAPAWAKSAPDDEADDEPEPAAQEAPPIVPRFFLRRGGRRIESGLRIEGSANGVRVAKKVFPSGGEPRGLPLPEHLGGGFLFYQAVGADGTTVTAFYRGETWTGELQPLGRIPFAVRHVAPGFDRVYALGVTLRAALDPQSGELLPLAPLPPLTTVEAIAFDGPRRALVQGPVSGVHYTRDAGLNWSRVPDAYSIEAHLNGSRLLVNTSQGLALVDESGVAIPLNRTGLSRSSLQTADFNQVMNGSVSFRVIEQEAMTGALRGEAKYHRDLLERKWLSVLTRGARLGKHSYAIEGGELLRLTMDQTLVHSAESTTVPPGDRCVGTSAYEPEGTPPESALFLCQGKATSARLLSADGQLSKLWESQSRALMLAKGGGAALFAGSCGAKHSSEGDACWLRPKGARDVQLPREFLFATLSALAVSQKIGWAIWFDPKADTIFAQSFGQGKNRRKSWKLTEDHSVAQFLREGSILPHASMTAEGITFWATWREKFVGVLLGDGEEPSFGAVQRPLRRALFDGARAVLWGAAGFAKQTIDGGLSFTELSLPYRSGDPELASVTHPTGAVTMGCSEVGCSLGRLLKVGWGIPSETEEELPPLRPFSIPGGTRFRFECGTRAASPERTSAGGSTFPDFWEESAPQVEGGFEGSSVGFPEDLVRMYAWGPADSAWNRGGRAQAYFVDPWRPEKVRRTAPTFQLFSSSLDAKTKMGIIDRSGFRFQSLDPSGRGGVLVFRGRSTTELFVYEEGKPLERFEGAADRGLRNLAGAVYSRGSYVAAFQQGSVLTVVRLAGGGIVELGQVNLGNSGQRSARLVRTHDGDLGIFMEGDAGLFIFPFSEQGEIGDPVVWPHEKARPEVCPNEARGFIVDRELSVAPYVSAKNGAPLAVNRVRARLVVGGQKACLESLSGRARGMKPVPALSRTGAEVPLYVLNSDSSGRRMELLCR